MDEMEILILIENEILSGRMSPNHRREKDNQTPLHMVAAIVQSANQKKSIDIAQMLLQKGADVNARNSENVPPIFYAMYCKNFELVELFLIHGAEISLIEKKYAIDSGEEKLIQLIGDYIDTNTLKRKAKNHDQISIRWSDAIEFSPKTSSPGQSSSIDRKEKRSWWKLWEK